MTTPKAPNYKKNVGRLSTDRFDFQTHIDGQNFRHKANQIDLLHTVIVNGLPKTNVQDTLEALIALTSVPLVPDATTTSKGIIRLANDLGGGTALLPTVTGIQNRPISTLAPTNGQVLTWITLEGNWKPVNPTTFTAGGDLSGSNISQQVVKATGDGVKFLVSSNSINFAPILPFTGVGISQSPAANSDGMNFTIEAQSGSGSNKNGGILTLYGGTKTGSGTQGEIRLSIESTSGLSCMVQASQPTLGSVLTLANRGLCDTFNMPTGTGDGVIFVGDCGTEPTASPTFGTILYSLDGKLKIRQADGAQFAIGSISNPSIQPTDTDTNKYTYIYKNTVNTTTGSGQVIATFPMADETTAYIEVQIIGKRLFSSGTDTAAFTLRHCFVRFSGGGPTAVGTQTTVDSRNHGAASGWTAPSILQASNNLIVVTGYNASTFIEWYAYVKIDVITT